MLSTVQAKKENKILENALCGKCLRYCNQLKFGSLKPELLKVLYICDFFLNSEHCRYILDEELLRGEWPSGLNSFRQMNEVKLGRVRSNSGWVTSEAWSHNSPPRPSEGTLN